MSIFSKIKHAFQHLGHDIAKVGKGFVHAVEDVGKTLAHDVAAVAKQTLLLTNDLIHMRMQKVLHDAVGLGETAFKGMQDLNMAVTDVGVKTLENAHINKKLDKVLHKVDQGRAFVRDIENRTVKSIGDSVNGVTDGAIATLKDAAHGRFGKMFVDAANTGVSALQLASDLTPEGIAATAATVTLQKTHLGGPVVDAAVEGVISGGRSGLKTMVKLGTKEAVKAEAHQELQKTLGDYIPTDDGSGSSGGGSGGGHGRRAGKGASGSKSHTVEHHEVSGGHGDSEVETKSKKRKHHHQNVDSGSRTQTDSNKKKRDNEVDSNQQPGSTNQSADDEIKSLLEAQMTMRHQQTWQKIQEMSKKKDDDND